MWQPNLSSHAVSSAAFLALILSAYLLSAAADALPAYSERIWGVQDGLPEQIVRAFAETKDRYLWIGTTGGLLRFDGARFVLYNRENTAAFTDNNIFCLTVSRDNALWIGSEGGGLIPYANGVFDPFSVADGLTNSFVRAVYEDHDGTMWIGTDNGLFRVAGNRLERVDNTSRFPGVVVHASYEDSHDGL